MTQVYFNGQWVAPEAAKVSVFDRGFLFGDGVYEVIPAFGRRLFGAVPHLDRLTRSLHEIGIENPLSRQAWLDVLARLVADCATDDVSIYIQVTRGAPAKRDHAYPNPPVAPTVLASASPLQPVSPTVLKSGARAITVPDLRWGRCDIKSVNLLPNIMARQQAVAAGAAEAILVREGMALEGAASNLFAVIDEDLITAPLGVHILGGVTRQALLDLIQRDRLIPVVETPIPIDRLFDAQEVFVTSSTRDLLPITRINEHVVGDGKPGEVWQRLSAAFAAYKREVSQ
ncbi:aminotransferase class IV [Halothiobacillus sp. DCM-1]|uniref:aminotransferase class IV n=1 Tax=Halothiobacillus sp. DCM-1 TaxID=3112558 RepID=UPI0032558E6F